MKTILKAIVDDDPQRVGALLSADPTLVSRQVGEARLYESKILHWLYVGDTALHLAAAGHRAEIVQLLLTMGANPNANANHRRSGPLHYAADGFVSSPAWDPNKQTKTVQWLLKSGAHVDAPDKNGATPLHRAVRTRCAAAVECLLAAGANPQSKNNSGSTPFHLAVQNTGRGGSGDEIAKDAQRKIIEVFLSGGVRPTLQDGKGNTVVDCAASRWIREM